MATIQKQSLVDQVYEKLRGEIITLQRPLGSKLNVNDMRDRLGVSCTPIREAINRLQQEGLVVYENNIGARVLSLGAHDVAEIQQLATTLHCAAARLAMQQGEHAAIAEGLERHLEEFRRAKTVQAEVQAVNRFVAVFYHNCGNERLDKSMISIQGQQLLLRYIFANAQQMRGGGEAEFAQMAAAVRAGDPERVCALLQQNADAAQGALMEFVAGTSDS